MAVPALGVYGPELFPTAARGAANGVINLASVVGSAIGLVLAGVLSDRFGGLGPAMAVLSIGGVAVVLLVLFLYPETASLELEDLNPHDAPLARELFAFEGLDPEFQVDRFPLGADGGPGARPRRPPGIASRATPRTRAPTGSLSPVPTSVNPRLPPPPVLVAALVAVALLLAAGCGSKDRPTLSGDTLPAASSTADRRDHHHDSSARGSPASPPARAWWPPPAAEGQLGHLRQPGRRRTEASTMANPRLINNDPNAKVPLTFLVADLPEAQMRLGRRCTCPVRPNGSTGWVKSSDVQFAVNDYRIEVTLSAFTLKVFKDGQQTEDIKVGVAHDNTPTPGGLYYTTELIKPPNPSGAYGPYAYGLSGFSDTLTTFNGGPGQLGIHGTNEPAGHRHPGQPRLHPHGQRRTSPGWPASSPSASRSRSTPEARRRPSAVRGSAEPGGDGVGDGVVGVARSWPPGSQTWVTGPGMAATASSNSSG